MNDLTSEGFEQMLLENVEQMDIDINERGDQSCNGAANMKGNLSGFRPGVSAKCRHNSLTDPSNNFNIVLNDTTLCMCLNFKRSTRAILP